MGTTEVWGYGDQRREAEANEVALDPGQSWRAINEDEPKPRAGLPECPEFLNAKAKREWARIVPELALIGLVTEIDRAALAACCQVYGRWVEAEMKVAEEGVIITSKTGYTIPAPSLTIASKAMRQMLAPAAEFGMTPSSRTRIRLGPMLPADPFDDLLRGQD